MKSYKITEVFGVFYVEFFRSATDNPCLDTQSDWVRTETKRFVCWKDAWKAINA